MRSFLVALRCLTILPLGRQAVADVRAEARCRLWFPPLGLVLGVILSLVAAVVVRLFGHGVEASAVIISFGVILTGALHLDGLADSFDGLFASGGRGRRLEIMRDPHLGTFGVLALVLCVVLKVTALGALEAPRLPAALVGATVAGRSALLVVAGLCPYARASGTGLAVISSAGLLDCAWGAAWMLGVAAVLDQPAAPLAMVLVLGAAAGWAGLCRWRLGGATGDCLGGACELAEALYLVAATGRWHAMPWHTTPGPLAELLARIVPME